MVINNIGGYSKKNAVTAIFFSCNRYKPLYLAFFGICLYILHNTVTAGYSRLKKCCNRNLSRNIGENCILGYSTFFYCCNRNLLRNIGEKLSTVTAVTAFFLLSVKFSSKKERK